jgi:hypothetical protein
LRKTWIRREVSVSFGPSFGIFKKKKNLEPQRKTSAFPLIKNNNNKSNCRKKINPRSFLKFFEKNMFLKIFVSFFALSFCVLEAEARGNYNVFKKVQTFLSEAKEYQENGEVAIEGRRTSSDEECLVLSLTMLTLFMPDGACDGLPSNSTESFDDFSPETLGQFCQIDGCMDALLDSYTALNDKECFDDGSGDDGGDTAVSMMKYACVEHPDGTLCVEKMSFLFDDESDNSLNCTHFTGYVPSFSLSLSLFISLSNIHAFTFLYSVLDAALEQ